MPPKPARHPDKNSLSHIQSPAWPGFFHAEILTEATDSGAETPKSDEALRDKKAMNF
jgi:hypothetical protein